MVSSATSHSTQRMGGRLSNGQHTAGDTCVRFTGRSVREHTGHELARPRLGTVLGKGSAKEGTMPSRNCGCSNES